MMRNLNSLDIAKPPYATRVVVAMSGGVDSSVVAALLVHEGYEVVGVTLQLYDHGAATHRKGACCAGQDIHDARRVAERLGIPHYVLDYEERFREQVIARFSEAYIGGETPVPCIACNQHIKFADLLHTARDIGAVVLATGHYVASRASVTGRRWLYRAHDLERDQSYFLFATTAAQLDMLRFPLGGLAKAEVRALARDFGLPIAEKADSQDICFVPTGRYTDVIERLQPGSAQPGDIVHVDGGVLGRHRGIIHYTIGQRRGLGVAAGDPLYVVGLDSVQARVLVGPRSALATRRVRLREINWIGDGSLVEALRVEPAIATRVRSTRSPAAARLLSGDEGAEVEFAVDEEGVSPGQACVFYESTDSGARVLGGGIIDSTVSAHVCGRRALPAAPVSSDRAAGACER